MERNYVTVTLRIYYNTGDPSETTNRWIRQSVLGTLHKSRATKRYGTTAVKTING